jgi:hypothetical protein
MCILTTTIYKRSTVIDSGLLKISDIMPYVKGADKGVCHESPWVGEPL